MLYMLDTNVCIYLIKKRPIQYFQRINTLSNDHTIAISSIVLSELQYGVENSEHRERNQKELNLLVGKLETIAYNESCALFYGQIKSSLKKSGKLIGGHDLLIASHALTMGAVLVTNNTSEFQRVSGLKIENWDLS
jgi:tRNA(fMet)-specific endonuclease VapC